MSGVLTTRNVLAAPLYALGGVVFAAGWLAAIGMGLYVNYLWWKWVIEDFNLVSLVFVCFATSISLMIVVTAGNLVSLAGAGLLTLAGRVRGLSPSSDDNPTHGLAPFEMEEDAAHFEVDEEPEYVSASGRFSAHRDAVADPTKLKCPDCGRQVTTANGLAQHRAAKHQGSLTP